MEVDQPADTEAKGKKQPRFEVKKWHAVALWTWDMQVDNCAICKNHLMELCERPNWNGQMFYSRKTKRIIGTLMQASNVKRIKRVRQTKNATQLGVLATTLSTSTASADG
ncbi:RING-box protein hrt1 [Cystobasidiomycetes sp. EMM_F5]